MSRRPSIGLEQFGQVTLVEKARIIEAWGIPLGTTRAFGLTFMLYAINNYFAEVALRPATNEILEIHPASSITSFDLYISEIDISDAFKK